MKLFKRQQPELPADYEEVMATPLSDSVQDFFTSERELYSRRLRDIPRNQRPAAIFGITRKMTLRALAETEYKERKIAMVEARRNTSPTALEGLGKTALQQEDVPETASPAPTFTPTYGRDVTIAHLPPDVSEQEVPPPYDPRNDDPWFGAK